MRKGSVLAVMSLLALSSFAQIPTHIHVAPPLIKVRNIPNKFQTNEHG
jgi:hypothetical protein